MTLFSSEELAERVRKGNKALLEAWGNGCDVNLFDSKYELLHSLCRQLQLNGFTRCLYSDKRECFTDDWCCLVCPVIKKED